MALKNPLRFARTAQRNRLGVAIAAALALPASALAQEALEEIVVTARFREENLQQTPLAITAITGDMLEARGATSTLDLDAFVPNAVIAPLGAGWGSTAAAFIRGIGLGDNSLSFEPGVPIYIDDVYHGRPQGAVLDLLDIERIEVLRGPQGTLFGKNTLGGAVRIISRKPEGDNTGFIDVGSRLARPLELAGVVRLCRSPKTKFLRACRCRRKRRTATSTSSTTNASTERARSAWAVPASPRARTASRSRPRRPIRLNPAWIAYAANTHPAIGGVRLGSVLGTTDARGCVVDHFGNEDVQSGRVAVRFLASDTVEVNVVADLTYSDQQGPADKYTVQLRTDAGVPPGVADADQQLEQQHRGPGVRCRRAVRRAFPNAGRVHELPPLRPRPADRAHHAEPQRAQAHRSASRPRLGHLRRLALQVHDCVPRFRQLVRPRLRRHAAARNLHLGYVEARAVHAGVPVERPHWSQRRRRLDDGLLLLRRLRFEPGLQQRLRLHVELLRP